MPANVRYELEISYKMSDRADMAVMDGGDRDKLLPRQMEFQVPEMLRTLRIQKLRSNPL